MCVLVRPEVDGEREDVDKGVDLKHAQEEHAEVLKGLQEEVPEEAQVRSVIRHRQTGKERGRERNKMADMVVSV